MVKREPSDSAAPKFAIIQEIEEGRIGVRAVSPVPCMYRICKFFFALLRFSNMSKKGLRQSENECMIIS
ncbi:hypothetical protein PaelaDRAFT_3866 [Paenibacillus lactis 154]|uniref:Uncharacterized protein n=1 Tax=Paenibacillus lactis 154 TaxID=743719 RepID=G4HIQ5_9BACL|nr:hypothetical protein PaelaDRAFT_3866 [Paenibacillus lactis 154]